MILIAPELAELALVPRPDRAAGGTALADPRQEGYAIPGGRLGVEPSCVAATGLSDKAQRIAVSRLRHAHGSVSTLYKCLYALEWGVFVKWCGQAHIDPATCTISDVLSFLQYRLDSGSLPNRH